MNAVKCSRGHYYEKDLGFCPICAAEQDSTVPPIGIPDPNLWEEAEPNISGYQTLAGLPYEPMAPQWNRVTGWLVCISGPKRGESFSLHEGRNDIGRSRGMDISLEDDPTVSRQNHVSILYESASRRFMLIPGNAVNPPYLNGRILRTAMQLNDRDRIRIGRSEFIFAPFCNQEFDWQDESQFCRP